jgi:hypothetical protein
MYDVPCYTRNLFNTEVIAYSGENDKQIQAARVMEEAYQAEGRTLTHLIGPGAKHEYEPKTLEELKSRLAKIADDPTPWWQRSKPHHHMQTRTLRYAHAGSGVMVMGLEWHWDDTRVDAVHPEKRKTGVKEHYEITTKNVSAFCFQSKGWYHTATIDEQRFEFTAQEAQRQFLCFEKEAGKWRLVFDFKPVLAKRSILGLPNLTGPIDDAFVDAFMVVTPSGKSKNPLVQRWVEFELQHFITRWRALMRGDVPMKKDVDVTEQDIQYGNLICFGDPDSNAIIRRAAAKLPVTWRDGEIVAGEQRWSAQDHVPALIYPNPLHTKRDIYGESQPDRQLAFDIPQYLVINSGLTFREAHDKTNSQQNPKLPDWAMIDLKQLPDDKSPGRIAAAGFFDEEWKYQKGEESQ